VAQQTVIVVLAITRDGARSRWACAGLDGERRGVQELLQDLLARLTLDGRVLCVIDGARAAQSARRCPRRRRADPTLQLHKGRNLDASCEDAARLRPGEPASSVSAASAPAARRQLTALATWWRPMPCDARPVCAKAWRKRSPC